MAIIAPCPMYGTGGCAASPSSITRPSAPTHVSRGGFEKMPTRIADSAARIGLTKSSCHLLIFFFFFTRLKKMKKMKKNPPTHSPVLSQRGDEFGLLTGASDITSHALKLVAE